MALRITPIQWSHVPEVAIVSYPSEIRQVMLLAPFSRVQPLGAQHLEDWLFFVRKDTAWTGCCVRAPSSYELRSLRTIQELARHDVPAVLSCSAGHAGC